MPEAAGPVGPPGDLVGDRASARAAVRAVRGGTHTAGWGQLLQDWYVGAFVTATLLTLLFAATGPSILRPDCAATCLSGTQHLWMAMAMGLLVAVAAAAGLRAAGPAWADPGRATWLLSTPADRGALLRGGVQQVAGVAAVAAGAWGVLTGFALAVGLGRSGSPVAPVVLTAVAGAVLALVLAAAALVRQGRARPIAAAARGVADADLRRAGEVTAAVRATTLMLDGTALDALTARRRLGRRGRFTSAVGVGGPLTGLLTHELRALVRRRSRLLSALLGCLAALAAGLLLGPLVGVVLTCIAGLVLARLSGGGLTAWVATPGLRRALPAHPGAVAAVLAVAPFALVGVGSSLALLPLGLPPWAPVAVAAGVTAAAVRAAEPPPPGLGLVVATPGGALPMGLVRAVVHGPDLAVGVGLLVLAADARGLWSLAVGATLALLGWQLLRPRE